MYRYYDVLFVVLLSIVNAKGDEITPEGKKLAAFYDSMHVEKLWLPGQYVEWKTGEPLNKPVTDNKPHTHCSAFAAAACQRLDVYLLRPPEHSSQYLANAQYDWLLGEGKKKDWKAVETAWRAQQLANQGQIVIAVYKENDPKKHGHIALVRPSEKSKLKVQHEGPQIIQAGMDNFVSASLVEGFKRHKDAWTTDQIRFYSHEANVK
jgi:hypothetical protein